MKELEKVVQEEMFEIEYSTVILMIVYKIVWRVDTITVQQ